MQSDIILKQAVLWKMIFYIASATRLKEKPKVACVVCMYQTPKLWSNMPGCLPQLGAFQLQVGLNPVQGICVALGHWVAGFVLGTISPVCKEAHAKMLGSIANTKGNWSKIWHS